MAATPLMSSDSSSEVLQEQALPFVPFTGKVTRSKVRLRTSPLLDAPVVKELDRGELLLIDGEKEDFYMVRPKREMRLYLMRNFVLDGVVEGSRVNVRLFPSVDAPVVTQLHTGDRVEGDISSAQPKWLEIKVPPKVRFYVAQEYVEKVGDEHHIQNVEKRQENVQKLYDETETKAFEELNKEYPQMDLGVVFNNLTQIIEMYKDFPLWVDKAQALQARVEQEELKKKVAFLENRVSVQSVAYMDTNSMKTGSKVASQKPHLSEKMVSWVPIEDGYYRRWMQKNPGRSMEDFYIYEAGRAERLKGIVEPFNRPIADKPGDYLLLTNEGRPIAYLYSTHVNLEEIAGQRVVLKAVQRPNKDFAFPAYYVLEKQ